MTTDDETTIFERTARTQKGLARAIGIVVSGVAAAVLVFGWGLGIGVMTRLLPGFPAMVPATAACLLLGGLAVLSIVRGQDGRVAMPCGALIAILTLWEYVSPIGTASRVPGDTMSAATQLATLILATSLLGQGLRRGRFQQLATLSDTLGLALTTIPLIGYIVTGDSLEDTPFFASMALHTAIGLALLFLALLLLRPQGSWTTVLVARESGSMTVRRFLPLQVIAILLFCGLAYRLQNAVGLDVGLIYAVLAFALIATSCAAKIYFAHQANDAERRVVSAERAYQESETLRLENELSLVRAQKIESLGQLVGGVAHDFNNLLEVILGNLDLVRIEPDESMIDSHLDEAAKAARQAAKLTAQLLAYGRKSRLEIAEVAPDDFVEPALDMFRRLCPPNITVETDLRAGRSSVNIDPNVFQQALLNVMINARDAMPDGGTLEVSSAVRRLSHDDLQDHTIPDADALEEGLYVTITVTDGGIGMNPETLTHSTEPFYTTKPTGMGSGLGLSMVEGFCRQSHGSLSISSRPGMGTEVTLWFPVVGEAVATPEDAPKPPARTARTDGKGSILIVDDQPHVSRVMARKLELLGYRVYVATDGQDALSLMATGIDPDLVISDVVMPGKVQGNMLAAAIRELYPDLPIILVSGRASGSKTFFQARGGPIPFLPKPVDMNELRKAIRNALNTKRED